MLLRHSAVGQAVTGPRCLPSTSRVVCPCRTMRHAPAPAAPRMLTRTSVFGKKAEVAEPPGLYDTMKKVNALAALSSVAVESTLVDAKRFSTAGVGERVGFIMSGDVEKDGVVMAIPEAQAVTSIDAEKQEVVGTIAGSGVSELVALTLWVLAERAKGAASAYAALLGTLPDRTNTPLLWSDEELGQLLFGSPVLAESMARKATLRSQWQAMHDEWFSKDPATFPASTYGYEPFANAFSVVLAHAIYLPSAGMFALLPVASLFGRTGNSNGSDVDYDEATGRVVVTAGRPYREGQELLLNDERPNGEVFMATGTVPENNNSDYLNFPAELIESDKYFVMKQQILESMGFETKQIFPVYLDRMPNQLYAYVRLSRVMDPALFAKVSFDQDVVLSQMNEYESLQVLMGDCRERLAAYIGTLEEDIKMSQRSELSVREKLAVRLRLTEKRILSKTMDAVRTKLAPVRGIPTKSGTFKDANSDLVEIFDALESIPAAPAALVNSFLSWAKGEQDPDWGKPRPKKDLPKRPW